MAKLKIIPLAIPNGIEKGSVKDKAKDKYLVNLVFKFEVDLTDPENESEEKIIKALRLWTTKIKGVIDPDENTDKELKGFKFKVNGKDFKPIKENPLVPDLWQELYNPTKGVNILERLTDLQQLHKSEKRFSKAYDKIKIPSNTVEQEDVNNRKEEAKYLGDFVPKNSLSVSPKATDMDFSTMLSGEAISESHLLEQTNIADVLISSGQNRTLPRSNTKSNNLYGELIKFNYENPNFIKELTKDQATINYKNLFTEKLLKEATQSRKISKSSAAKFRELSVRLFIKLFAAIRVKNTLGLTIPLTEENKLEPGELFEKFKNLTDAEEDEIKKLSLFFSDPQQAKNTIEADEEQLRQKSFSHVYARCSQYPVLMEKLGFCIQGHVELEKWPEKWPEKIAVKLVKKGEELPFKTLLDLRDVTIVEDGANKTIELVEVVEREVQVAKQADNTGFYPARKIGAVDPRFYLSQYDPMMTAVNAKSGNLSPSGTSSIFIVEDNGNEAYLNAPDLSKKVLYAEDLVEGFTVEVVKDKKEWIPLCSRDNLLKKISASTSDNNIEAGSTDKTTKKLGKNGKTDKPLLPHDWTDEGFISRSTTAVSTPYVGLLSNAYYDEDDMIIPSIQIKFKNNDKLFFYPIIEGGKQTKITVNCPLSLSVASRDQEYDLIKSAMMLKQDNKDKYEMLELNRDSVFFLNLIKDALESSTVDEDKALVELIKIPSEKSYEVKVLGVTTKENNNNNETEVFNYSFTQNFTIGPATTLSCIHRPYIDERDVNYDVVDQGDGKKEINADVLRVVISNTNPADKVEIYPLFDRVINTKPLSRVYKVKLSYGKTDESYFCLKPTALNKNIEVGEDTTFFAASTVEGKRGYLSSKKGVSLGTTTSKKNDTAREGISLGTTTSKNNDTASKEVSVYFSPDLPQISIAKAHIDHGRYQDKVTQFKLGDHILNRIDFGGRIDFVRGFCRGSEMKIAGVYKKNLEIAGNTITLTLQTEPKVLKVTVEVSEGIDVESLKDKVAYSVSLTGGKENEWKAKSIVPISEPLKLLGANPTENAVKVFEEDNAQLPAKVRQLKDEATLDLTLTIQTKSGENREVSFPNSVNKKLKALTTNDKDTNDKDTKDWIDPIAVPSYEDLCDVVVDNSSDRIVARAWPRYVYGSYHKSPKGHGVLVCPDGDRYSVTALPAIDNKKTTGFFKIKKKDTEQVFTIEQQASDTPPKWVVEVGATMRDVGLVKPMSELQLIPSQSPKVTWNTEEFIEEDSAYLVSHKLQIAADDANKANTEKPVLGRIADLEVGDCLLCQPLFTSDGKIILTKNNIEQVFLMGHTKELDREKFILSKVQDGVAEYSKTPLITASGKTRNLWLPDDVIESLAAGEYAFVAAPCMIAKSITPFKHSRSIDANKALIASTAYQEDTEVEPVHLVESGNLCRWDGWSLVCSDPSEVDEGPKSLIHTIGGFEIESEPDSKVRIPSLRCGSLYSMKLTRVNALANPLFSGPIIAKSKHRGKNSKPSKLLFKRPYAPGAPIIAYENTSESNKHLKYIAGEIDDTPQANELNVATNIALQNIRKHIGVENSRGTYITGKIEFHLLPPPVSFKMAEQQGVLDVLYRRIRDAKNPKDKLKEQKELKELEKFIKHQETHYEDQLIGERKSHGSEYLLSSEKGKTSYKFTYFACPMAWPVRCRIVSKYRTEEEDKKLRDADDKFWLSFFEKRNPKTFSPIQKKGTLEPKKSIFGVSDATAYKAKEFKSSHVSLEQKDSGVLKNENGKKSYRKLYIDTRDSGLLPPAAQARIKMQSDWPTEIDINQRINGENIFVKDTVLDATTEEIEVSLTHAVNMPLIAPTTPVLSLLEQRKQYQTNIHFTIQTEVERHSTGRIHADFYWNEFFDQRVGVNHFEADVDIVQTLDGSFMGFNIINSGFGYGEYAYVLVTKQGKDSSPEIAYDIPVKVINGEVVDLTYVKSEDESEDESEDIPNYIKNAQNYHFRVVNRAPLLRIASGSAEIVTPATGGNSKVKSGKASKLITMISLEPGKGYFAPPYAVILNAPQDLPTLPLNVEIDHEGQVTGVSIQSPKKGPLSEIIDELVDAYYHYFSKKGDRMDLGFFTHHREVSHSYAREPSPYRPNINQVEAEVFEDVTLDFEHMGGTELTAIIRAESRFKDLLASNVLSKPLEAFELSSHASSPLQVRATARPEPLRIKDLTYAYQWSKLVDSERTYKWDGHSETEISRKSFVRVYMHRPFIDGHLAVILHRSRGNANTIRYTEHESVEGIIIPEEYRPYVSRWGYDPLFEERNYPALAYEHFTSVEPQPISVFLAERGEGLDEQITALLHKTFYDEEKGLWYSDIGLDIPVLGEGENMQRGLPFVKFSLTRFNTNAVGGLEMSYTKECDAIKLQGEHLVTLTRDAGNKLIKIKGPYENRHAEFPQLEIQVQFMLKDSRVDSIVEGEVISTFSSINNNEIIFDQSTGEFTCKLSNEQWTDLSSKKKDKMVMIIQEINIYQSASETKDNNHKLFFVEVEI